MRFEDALIYVTVDCRGMLPGELGELCREAIDGGADIIELGPGKGEGLSRELVGRVVDVCREENSILLIRDEPSLARDVGAAGVHLTQGGVPIGYARSILSRGSAVGLSSDSIDQAILALDLDPDFLICFAGTGCLEVFPKLRGLSSSLLFAGGIRDVDEAQRLVEGGVYRLCVDLGVLRGSVTDSVAAFSKVLGREM